MSVTPSNEQNKAIKAIVEWYESDKMEFYLAGYAGVGKSTVANIAINELREKCGVKKVKTAAYTGKAASVLRNKGIYSAQTIHSLIYTVSEDEEGNISFDISTESDAAEADLIVLDECSMIDKSLADDLRSFGKKILVMGDPGQLPPINGYGDFTNHEPDVFLTEIHRQAAESPIIELATMARMGKRIPDNYLKNDVSAGIINRDNQALIYGLNTQPICGLNRVRHVYNQRIRGRRGFSGTAPQKGERIICCKNNKEIGIYNGGMGVLTKISTKKILGKTAEIYAIEADMEDVGLVGCEKPIRVDPYLFSSNFNPHQKIKMPKGQRLDEFDFGYVITCHKAQGSSWPHVTVIDDSAAFKENRNKWLYTAITRAESGLTLLLRDAA